MEEKICFKCNAKKPLSEFYKHSEMKDGHLNKCKDCTKTDSNIRYSKLSNDSFFLDKERKRGRDKYRRLYEGTGKARPENNKRYAKKFPEKKAAIISSGHLKPPKLGLEKHHWSYNEEHYKDVIWLTKKHHKKAHRFLIYDQDLKMYKTTGNQLLCTKDIHLEYILYKILNEDD